MLSRRLREKWDGKSLDNFITFLQKLYPLGQVEYGGGGGIVYNTGLSSDVIIDGVVYVGKSDIVIVTGMYVDDDENIKMDKGVI